jgi:hypothetical protein
VNGRALNARIILAGKVEKTSANTYRYEYALYNMNSVRGIRAFSVPIGNASVSAGMSGVGAYGERWSNAPWAGRVAEGRITWSVPNYETDPNANAIRWGTTYNFWFETTVPPADAQVTIEKFAPGEGVSSLAGELPAPVGSGNGGVK